MKYLYRIYQLFIGLPLFIIATIITALTTSIGCVFGNGNFWGYYPGKLWGRFVIRLFLLPVKVVGRENINKKQSYVFVANHQGAFDIFLIYGFLGRNFKWMMKQSLRKVPLVGTACYNANHIFVDRGNAAKIKKSYEKAEGILRNGMSLMVFPEGARTYNGKISPFKRGAFMLANELQLPIIPITINGSFKVLPRKKDGKWLTYHPLTLTIHSEIAPIEKGNDKILELMQMSKDLIEGSLHTECK